VSGLLDENAIHYSLIMCADNGFIVCIMHMDVHITVKHACISNGTKSDCIGTSLLYSLFPGQWIMDKYIPMICKDAVR
jgi:hypothetical protein